VDVDSTKIVVSLGTCDENNGALITDYVLFVQAGFDGQFIEFGTYDISQS